MRQDVLNLSHDRRRAERFRWEQTRGTSASTRRRILELVGTAWQKEQWQTGSERGQRGARAAMAYDQRAMWEDSTQWEPLFDMNVLRQPGQRRRLIVFADRRDHFDLERRQCFQDGLKEHWATAICVRSQADVHKWSDTGLQLI
jgi:hypothetical protein